MAKFKVGDKVRMVKLRSDGLSYSFDKIGNEGVVKWITPKFIEVDVHCKDNTWTTNGWPYPLGDKCWEVIEEEKEMPKCKFKAGDKVKVKRGFYHGHKDGGIGVIADSHPSWTNAYRVEIKGFVQLVEPEDLELVKETKKPRIIRLGDLKIVFNGDYTIVTDGRFTGKAKRHADDEYDAIKGLEIAMMRYEIDGGFCLE